MRDGKIPGHFIYGGERKGELRYQRSEREIASLQDHVVAWPPSLDAGRPFRIDHCNGWFRYSRAVLRTAADRRNREFAFWPGEGSYADLASLGDWHLRRNSGEPATPVLL